VSTEGTESSESTTRTGSAPRQLPVGLLAVAVALTALTAVGTAAGQPRPKAAAQAARVEVVGSTSVCPDLRQQVGRLASRASIGVGPLPSGRTASSGRVELDRATAPGKPSPTGLTAPGQVAVNLGTRVDRDALQITAGGSLAASLEAEQVTRGEGGRERGLAGLRCAAASRETWFEGGGTSTGDESTLILVNVDDTPATVDVTAFSSTGPADPKPGQGLTVPPHSRTITLLDRLAPNLSLLAVHVVSRRGRVAAALRYSSVSGDTAAGVDWVPQTVPPATTVVVPGFPQSGDGQRSVLITNPTTDDTTVSVRITTETGQFVPTGLDQLNVPAGTTVTARLDNLTLQTSLAATITSSGSPILAGGIVRDAQRGSPVRELAFTGGTGPLSGPALLTDLVINTPTESTLILSAPSGAATVVVSPIRVTGTTGALPAPKTLRIAAGRTLTLKLSTFYPPRTDAQLALEVRPTDGSGPVYAARYLRERGAHGPLTTLLDLQGPAQEVSRPVVSIDAGLGN
jgi:hypothetical protein